MKKKLVLMLVLIASLMCIFAITSSAASLSNFVDVKLTLVDGTEATAYLENGVSWGGYDGYDRRNLYKSYEDTTEKIEWVDVKIFDMRESQIYTYDSTNGKVATGTYPETLLQHPTNPNNVTHFYYPQGSVIIADSSFGSGYGWSSLEYLWIPNSVEIIGQFICKDISTLENVEIEDGSQIIEIRKEAFKGCSNLTSFDFPETTTTIGYCAFYQTGLNGKVVLPNAVTSIGDAAFRTTKIETLVIGDGPVSLGYNLVGNDAANSSYLKEIYIPTEATFVRTAETCYKSTNDTGLIKFYVIGAEGEDCSEFITTLKGTGRVTFATQTEIDAGTAASGYSAVIIEGYNKCDAFYKSLHNESDDYNCETDNNCSRCNILMTEAISHSIDIEIVYKNGFGSEGDKIVGCTNSNCAMVEETTSVGAIFEAIGYSTNSAKNALCGGYKIHLENYNAYKDAAGTSLEFGMIIVNANSFENGVSVLDADGKLTSTRGLQVEMNSSEYSNFNCKINNFSEDNKVNLHLVVALYVIDEAGNVSFIQAENSYSEDIEIGNDTFKAITLEKVIENNPEVSVVALLPNNDEE